MREKLRRGLQQLQPESVAIELHPKPKVPVIPEHVVAEHISNKAKSERFETVESVSVYTKKMQRSLNVKIISASMVIFL